MTKARFIRFPLRVASALALALLVGVGSVSTFPAPAVAAYSSGSGVSTPERLMQDLQRDYGLSAQQAAGWVGNFGHESGNFKYQEELQPNKYGTKGYGFAQWTGSRRTELFNHAASLGLDVNSYEAQYSNLRRELDGSYASVMNKVRNASSAEEAARIVMEEFERPSAQYAHLDRRVALANAYLNGDYSGAGAMNGSGGGGGLGGGAPVTPPPTVVLMPWA